MNRSEPLRDQAGRLRLRQLGEKAPNKKNYAIKYVLFRQLATASAEEGEFNDALSFYEKALGAAQKMGNLQLECDTLIDLASTADNLNMVDAAIDYYEKALKIAQEMGDFATESSIKGKIGYIFLRTSNFELAADLFTQATEAATKAKQETIVVSEERPTVEPTTQKGSTIHRPGSSPAIQELTETSNQIAQMDRERQVLVYGCIGLSILGVIVFLVTGQVPLVVAMNAPLLAIIGRGLFSK